MSKKARDLLPPDGPNPVKATDVRRSDDDLEPEVEARKIGIRRVSCLEFGNRMRDRARWRPAGNSRRFWRQIEADDPFKKAPARPTDAPIDIYPSQRIDRTSGSLPKPQPEVARAYPPPRQEDAPQRAARPLKEAKRTTPRQESPPPRREIPPPKRTPSKPPPEARHTPDPRTARAPNEAPPPPPEEPKHPLRHLPPMPKKTRTRTGRTRIPSRAVEKKRVSPEELRRIREEKAKMRRGEEEGTKFMRTDESVVAALQKLRIQEEAYRLGLEAPPEDTDRDDTAVRRPKPKGEVKRKSRTKSEREVPRPRKTSRTPKPQPAPKPLPAPKPTPPPTKAAPSAKGNAGGLDDLFGGGGDRVRIGRRSKPSNTGPEET